MKKIGIIARGITKGGVGRFIKNILLEFDKRKDFDFYLLYNQKEFDNEKYVNIKKVFINSKNKLKFDYIDSYNKIKELKLNSIIYPKNIIPLTHFKLKCKKYNIILDLGYFEKKLHAYPFLDTLFMKTFMKKSCQKADKIFAISESTKKDIVRRFKINKKKIKVIPLAAEDDFKQIKNKKKLNKTIKKYGLKFPFLLYSGGAKPRKNLLRILKSFKKIKDDLPHNIYITGGSVKKVKKVISYIEKNLKNRVKILGYVSENDLINLYNLADLYLYPSLYEGFGLPILEAQACGCPVLTSNVTSCPEVAGKGALIVNPYSEREIGAGILKILNNKKYKKEVVRRGYENIKRFSWKKTADKILEGLK